MITVRKPVSNNDEYEKYYVVTELNADAFKKSRELFEGYCGEVILNKSFEDDTWILTNQVRKKTFEFATNQFGFKKYAEKWLGCSYDYYITAMKTYFIFYMGKFSLSGLGQILKTLKSISECSSEELEVNTHIIDFLKGLPDCEDKDCVIEHMEEAFKFGVYSRKKNTQRVLADFDAYFKLNDTLNQFWNCATKEEKLYYFPLYLWWNVTAILPLRPTEFLLTPLNCLERNNGKNVLIVRRTKLKAKNKNTYYTIDKDYELCRYLLPDHLADEIEWYINETKNMQKSKYNTLFCQKPHYDFLNKAIPKTSVYYSYGNLSVCLKKFQHEIMNIQGNDNEINLGDTRHLAMINLIVSGGSPVICKELAGHEDINISSHYYANISKFIECATYEIYRKSKNASTNVSMSQHRLSSKLKTVSVENGLCDSKFYVMGSVEDCIKVMGSNGEIGKCNICPHYIDGKTGRYILFEDADKIKKQIESDSEYLRQVIELVRKGKGYDEDIQSALLKLQHSSYRYGQYIFAQMEGRK